MSARRLRIAGLLGFVLVTMLLPGSAHAHLHRGHVIVGAAAIDALEPEPGPSGWTTLSIDAVVGPSGTTGSVTVDQESFDIACARVDDGRGFLDSPTYHFARVEWTVEGVRYELRISVYAGEPTTWFHINTLVGDGTPCVAGGWSAGGFALGRGQVAIIG